MPLHINTAYCRIIQRTVQEKKVAEEKNATKNGA